MMLLMMMKMKLAALIPLAAMMIKLKALKALIIAKIALFLSILSLLKKKHHKDDKHKIVIIHDPHHGSSGGGKYWHSMDKQDSHTPLVITSTENSWMSQALPCALVVRGFCITMMNSFLSNEKQNANPSKSNSRVEY